MRIGLLVCGAFSDEIMKKHDGTYEKFFVTGLSAADSSLSFQTYMVFENEFPQSIGECDGWLVTGSKSGVYEDLPWIPPLLSFIAEAYKENVPLVGICFGHQALAKALGAQVKKADSGWGLGYQQYEMLEPIEGISAETLNLHAFHQDQVLSLPEGARVIAKTDHCPYAALIYKGRAISFQPHPEFSRIFEIDLITSVAGDTVPEELADEAIAGLAETSVHNAEIMKVVADFYLGTT